MLKYHYVAINHLGKQSKGLYEATSKQQVINQLRSDGLYVIRIKEKKPSLFTQDIMIGGPRVKLKTFTVFCRQLATLIESGIPMIDAVTVLANQMDERIFKQVLLQVKEKMERGLQFSVATSHIPTVFTPVFVHMVRAGEASGNLGEILDRLASFYEKEHGTREKVKSALIYPAIMSVLVVLVVTFMMIFVIPSFVENFEEMGLELPLPTKIVMNISAWFVSYWYIVMMLIISPFLLIALLKRHPSSAYWLDYIKLKTPIFGTLLHRQSLARFSRTFSSLDAASVPMLDILNFLSTVVGNEVLKRVIVQAQEAVRNGASIAQKFGESTWFSPMVRQMLIVGEQTGSLDEMMDKLANFYEEDVDEMAERLKTALEPLMILLLAGIVGGIVLSMMMPTFAMMEGL